MPPPGGPGGFYPYWTQARVGGQCVWEFGQMQNGRTFGGTGQYGGPSDYFFGNLEGALLNERTSDESAPPTPVKPSSRGFPLRAPESSANHPTLGRDAPRDGPERRGGAS